VARRSTPEVFVLFPELLSQLPDAVGEVGPLGVAYFCAAFCLSSVLLLPVTPLMLCCGFLFGGSLGFAVLLLAIASSASLTFLLSRTLLRSQVQAMVAGNAELERVNEAVECESFKIILLLRLSPLVPYAASCYALGLSRVSAVDYIVATLIGYSPWLAALSYVSALLGDGLSVPTEAYVAGAALTIAFGKLISDVVQESVDRAAEECSLAKP
jgi:uncharacterized membrane protein YdjX (TVP38/TMEM64 family)